MGLSIGTNMAAMAVTRHLSNATNELGKSYQRLASGERIVNAGDDSAGLAISENLRSQIRSMTQAQRNASDGVSFAQVAEGGLTEIGDMMIRLRELGVQASSDTVGDRERGLINQEGSSLVQEIDRLANATNFNGIPLLNAQAPKGQLVFQVGIHNKETDHIVFDSSSIDVRASSLNIDSLDYTSMDGARDTLDKLDEGMSKVYSARATLGAIQNKLQSTVRNLDTNIENVSEAHSRIADTDIATETSKLVRGNILQSAATAVLAQANQMPSLALKLL